MSVEGLPLQVGDSGAAVRDLHRRLVQAGFSPANSSGDRFTDETEQAVQSFQQSRGLEVDGIVGRQTWGALAEAAHRLGDRLLYQKSSPMLRGDDVADLQRRLGTLGFDAGRVDGIFGPDTAAAVNNFQRNAGLPTDAIFGPESLAAIDRLGGDEGKSTVAVVRERERLLTDAGRDDACRVALGELGGLGAVVDTYGRRLRQAGLGVEIISHPDESHHARVANSLDVDLCLVLLADEDTRCTASYFATKGFESAGGMKLAKLLVHELAPTHFEEATVLGQRLPVLRETRMPAVVLRIGPTHTLVEHSPATAEALTTAIVAWAAARTDE